MAMTYHFHDIKLTSAGDLDFNTDSRDFSVTDDIGSFDQMVKMRCLCNTGDIPLHSDICANLETIEGKPNTRTTGNEAEQLVYDALYSSSDFPSSEVTVKAVPTDKNQISVFVYADITDYRNTTRVYVNVPVFLDGRLVEYDS